MRLNLVAEMIDRLCKKLSYWFTYKFYYLKDLIKKDPEIKNLISKIELDNQNILRYIKDIQSGKESLVSVDQWQYIYQMNQQLLEINKRLLKDNFWLKLLGAK